jgi:hypothetical protein
MSAGHDEIDFVGHFDYFMVRSRRAEGAAPDTLSGVIERLRTGEKRPFQTSQELVSLMEMWADVSGNIAPPVPSGNAPRR